MKLKFLFFAVFLFFISLALGQGVTTSSLTGKVVDKQSASVPGATVAVLHLLTNTFYGTVTNSDGYFRLNNLLVGGPYRITVSFIGHQTYEKDVAHLSLGKTLNLQVTLQEEATTLEAVNVIARTSVIDGNSTGARTTIDNQTIIDAPTVGRNLVDLTRLTPSASVTNGGGISIQGINNRYNSIFIDGAVNNDVFGLANSGTNGGQAGISPISFDALDQITVNVSPYDVTLGGFSGAGINAVTRSGTNEFEGSAYYIFSNQSFANANSPITEQRQELDYTNQIYGLRVGGPIVKDKLFFFFNAEIEDRVTPLPFSFDGYDGTATVDSINALVDYVNTQFNYDPGTYTEIKSTTEGQKFFLKLNWNASRNHKFSIRHSYVNAETFTLGDNNGEAPNSRRIVFQNYGYEFPTTTNSFAAEWNGQFGNKFSNKLIFGLTTVRDDRDIAGEPFPNVEIRKGAERIELGTNNFSYSNVVNQDIFTLTNNFTWYAGTKHTLTFGTHNELFNIQNLFVIFSTPRYRYDSFDQFISGSAPNDVIFGHEIPSTGQDIRLADAAGNLGPTFKALQVAVYAQDEWQIKSNFKLNLGIRVDIPVYLEDAPLNNEAFNTTTVPLLEQTYDLQGARASRVPKTTPLFGPRIGFNWDIKDDQTMQLRGGAGIFTSRIPWVWPAGVYIRNGLNSGLSFGPERFFATPQEWLDSLSTTNSPSGDVDIFAKDFKYPQNLRASLGFDIQLPWGLVASVEGSYNKTINNIDVKNVNLGTATGRLEGADDRLVFNNFPTDPTYFGFITLLDNTNRGGGYNVTLELKKSFDKGFTGSVAYSYTDNTALFDGTSFINSSQWTNLATVNGRNAGVPLSRSSFSSASRITSFLSYRKSYLDRFATTVSLFFSGQSGRPFSYVYGEEGNLTNEVLFGVDNRSLIYVPASASEIVFVGTQAEQEAQWNALNQYIEGDDYLSTRRGQYAERNSNRTPFEGIFDVKITQEFYIKNGKGKKHAFQVSLDIFNVGNLIFGGGKRYTVNDSHFPLIQFEGFQTDASGNATNTPTFSFAEPGDPWNVVDGADPLTTSRWTGQLTLRYLFGR